jgi:hypothetical protein
MPPTSNEPQQEKPQTVHDQSKLKPYSFLPKKRVLLITITGILTIALVAFISLALIANKSTPDQKLYGFKTTVVEKVIRATKLSDSSKLEYTTKLLENRVAELLALYSDQSTSSPQTLDRIASLTQQHTGDSVWMIDNSKTLSPQEKILALASITNTTRAFETLTDDWEEFDSIKDYSSDIQNIGQDSLKVQVEQFASSSDTTAVSTFIGEQISIVGEELKTVAPNSRAQQLALVRIDDSGEYITDARFGDAIYALMRARQAIAVDRYLYANERGEETNETYDPGVAPEGS